MDVRSEHATHNPFKHAGDGLLWAMKTQPNYRVHLVMSIIAIILGFIVKLALIEWIVIVLMITIGLVIEAINTAIEATNNAISHEWKQEIKIAKDVSAAAMLTYAIGATIIAFMLYIPKLILFIG
jgi:diacylglycerol kinase